MTTSHSHPLKEVFRYLGLIYNKRYLFFGTAILVTILVTAFAYTLPKEYQADSTVFIEESVINDLVKGLAVAPDMEHRIRVLQYALTSRELIAKVLKELDSDIFTKSKSEQQEYISSLRKKTKIAVRGKKDLFTISIIDKDPKFAQEFVNTLVSKYVEENISSKRTETYGANRFLKEQIALFKKKLDEAENAIITFRKQKGVYFSRDEATLLEEIRQYKNDIENIKLDLATIKARIKRLRAQLRTISPTVDIFTGAQGTNTLASLEHRLAELLMKYTENYPEVIRLKAQIEELKRKQKESGKTEKTETTSSMTSVNPLYQQVQQQIFEAEVEASSLKAKKENLEKRIHERETLLREVPETRKKLAVLIQERDSVRKIYQELLGRLAQSEVSKQMEISDKAATFRIIDPALYPEVPVSPDMRKMLLLALAAGLACGFGLIYLLDLLDNTIKSPHQLEAMGLNPLAVIPTIDDPREVDSQGRLKDFIFFTLVGLFYVAYLVLLIAEILDLEPAAMITALFSR
jgi:polysaccharide chain length determinant protein (PEP-CTERM system associated)